MVMDPLVAQISIRLEHVLPRAALKFVEAIKIKKPSLTVEFFSAFC